LLTILEFLVDLLGINIETEGDVALWPVIARILRQISMLKDMNKDAGGIYISSF
jgi:hypothetical protein